MYYVLIGAACNQEVEFNTLTEAIDFAKKEDGFIFCSEDKTFVFDVKTMRKLGEKDT